MRVLLTGAAGKVAAMLRPYLVDRFGSLVLTDRREPEGLADGETFVLADLLDDAQALAACKDIDAIVHFAGLPGEGSWADVFDLSMRTTANLLEAARQAGVGRFLFASSNHVIGHYPRTRRLKGLEPVLPDSRYGVAKVFGEAALALYADKHGMKCLSIRIGTVVERPRIMRELATFIHPEDLVQLIEIGVRHPDVRNDVVWGISDNAKAWWDNSRAVELGYRPAHRAQDHVAFATEGELRVKPDPVSEALQGGSMASDEFTGSLEALLDSHDR